MYSKYLFSCAGFACSQLDVSGNKLIATWGGKKSFGDQKVATKAMKEVHISLNNADFMRLKTTNRKVMKFLPLYIRFAFKRWGKNMLQIGPFYYHLL